MVLVKLIFQVIYFKKNLLTQKINLDFIGEEEVYNNLTANVYAYEKQISKIKKQIFLNNCKTAISTLQDFSYECNLRFRQIQLVKLFDDANYNLNLWFFYMPNIKRCKERVQLRVKNKGHDVDDYSIKVNFEEGLQVLDKSFDDWDQLVIIDNVTDFTNENNSLSMNILLVANKGKILYCANDFPCLEIQSVLTTIPLKCMEWKESKKK